MATFFVLFYVCCFVFFFFPFPLWCKYVGRKTAHHVFVKHPYEWCKLMCPRECFLQLDVWWKFLFLLSLRLCVSKIFLEHTWSVPFFIYIFLIYVFVCCWQGAAAQGCSGYGSKSQNIKMTLEKKNSHTAPAGTRTQDLSLMSPAPYHSAIPTPQSYGDLD